MLVWGVGVVGGLHLRVGLGDSIMVGPERARVVCIDMVQASVEWSERGAHRMEGSDVCQTLAGGVTYSGSCMGCCVISASTYRSLLLCVYGFGPLKKACKA